MRDLVTVTQAAQRLGVSSRAVRRALAHDGAPAPISQAGNARQWEWHDVLAYYGSSQRRLIHVAKRAGAL